MAKILKNIGAVFSYIVLTAYAALSTYPFLWMVSSALRSNQEVLTNKSLIPIHIRFDIIVDTWNKLSFFKYFLNSAVIAVISVVGIILIYSLAGYGFSMTQFFGKNFFFTAFLGIMLVPGVTVLVPLVQLLRSLGLIGPKANEVTTYIGLIMPTINGAGPFAIFLFRNYFSTLPGEIHDAALVDGCNEWDIYARIFFPLSVPAVATIGITNFIGIWNAYIWPSVVLNKSDWFTLPLKLKDLDLQIVIQWNVRMAGSLITIIPILIVFLLLQRYYIRGLTLGAMKG
jgi:multiple sugar transport system permease protein